MSLDFISATLKLGTEISGCRRLVLLALANRANEDGFCYPSRELIAAEIGIKRQNTVTEHLTWLEERGYIERYVNGWAGEQGELPKDRRPNLYRLTFAIGADVWDPAPFFVERERKRKRGGTREPVTPPLRGGTRKPVTRGYTETGDPGVHGNRVPNHHVEPSVEPSVRNAGAFREGEPHEIDTPKTLVVASTDVERLAPPPLTLLSSDEIERLDVARRLCAHLADSIERSTPSARRPAVTEAWVTSMERMLRIDKRTPEQVRNCIDWVFMNSDDDFWVANIRSPIKLRAKYDTIEAQARRRRPERKPSLQDKIAAAIARQPDAVEIVEEPQITTSARSSTMLMSAPPLDLWSVIDVDTR